MKASLIKGANPNLYKHGLPFSEIIAYQLDRQLKRVEAKKASCIIVDGSVGDGKTTLGVEIGDYIQGSEIDLTEQIGYGGEDFQKKLKFILDSKGKKIVILYDEAGDFDKRGAITKFNKMINRIFQIYRGFKIIVILCLPNFSILDKRFFENKIPRLLLNVHNRGLLYGNIRGYSLKRMFSLLAKMKAIDAPPQAYNFVQPNFRGHFKDLSPERSKKLDEISTAAKIKILEDNIQNEYLTRANICKNLEVSRIWFERLIKKHGIEPDKVKGNNRHYYSNATYDKIKELKREEGYN